ncbi:DUF3616 domain-containing protein [Rhodoplanes elegans]|uniref:DUF3616 domain-containing protein n=1 Tax=Rhodoplanes elegans TaxID=29408 RepID=UPI0014731E8E|nr:DUF3616 domain-containing protein [Rhodoplanes elegans]
MTALLATASAVVGALASAFAQQPQDHKLTPTKVWVEPASDFKTDEEQDGRAKPVADDLSGIACMRRGAALGRCLVINDEDRYAQFADIGDRQLRPAGTIELVQRDGEAIPSGRAPVNVSCTGGERAFADLDGEAVAYAAPYFYVIGSHGCSRNKKRFRASTFVTARFRVDESGTPVNPATGAPPAASASVVQATYRVADALVATPNLKPFFTTDLNEADGLNIEGLVVLNGVLFAGLRGPAKGGAAVVEIGGVDELFAPGSGPLSHAGRLWPIGLKAGQGIRDMAALDDGRVLILAGPGQEKADPYEIRVADPAAQWTSRRVGTLDLGPLGPVINAAKVKPEGLMVLGQEGDIVRVLILSDGLPNGGAREYELRLGDGAAR